MDLLLEIHASLKAVNAGIGKIIHGIDARDESIFSTIKGG